MISKHIIEPLHEKVKSSMKRLFVLLIFLFSFSSMSFSQVSNFIQDDCDGQTHDLYQALDSGHIVVIEFVMDCQLCIDAGHALESLFAEFEIQHPGVIRVYQIAYSTLMDCNAMKAFRDTNNFQNYVFEENSHLLAYYGGFGMPTIGVAAGPNHTDIFSSVGFTASDTAQLGAVLRNYFATISVDEIKSNSIVTVFPNPSKTFLNILTEKEIASVKVYNVIGELILDESITNYKLDLAEISNGVYYLQAFTNDHEILTGVFVKQ